jgi:hypothetical protein
MLACALRVGNENTLRPVRAETMKIVHPGEPGQAVDYHTPQPNSVVWLGRSDMGSIRPFPDIRPIEIKPRVKPRTLENGLCGTKGADPDVYLPNVFVVGARLRKQPHWESDGLLAKAAIRVLPRPSSTPAGIDAFSDPKTRSVGRSRPCGADIDSKGMVWV